MKKKTAVIITLVLLLLVPALIYMEDSCYYQMTRVKTSAVLDPEQCRDENRPLLLTIRNESKYDVIQYGFLLGVYGNADNDRLGHNAYTIIHSIPQAGQNQYCYAAPEVEAMSASDINNDHHFKMVLFIINFATGDGKRRLCR
jgi:hypothetical protein